MDFNDFFKIEPKSQEKFQTPTDFPLFGFNITQPDLNVEREHGDTNIAPTFGSFFIKEQVTFPKPAIPLRSEEKGSCNRINTNVSKSSAIVKETQDRDEAESSPVSHDKFWTMSKVHDHDRYSQWLCLLKKTAKEESKHTFKLSSAQVKGILYLCDILKVNDAIKFRSLELYDRYEKLFSKKMFKYLKDSSDSDMEVFYERYESQIMLRMATCVLIASKLHADTQLRALTPEKISNLLEMEDYTYSAENVARSELRVLEILSYKCHWTMPLDLVEQLLSLLNLKEELMERAHHFCILLLEFFYTDLEHIRLQYSASAKKKLLTNDKISVPLECAGVVATALFIVTAETRTDQNFHRLVAKTASLPEEDVHTLAIVLLDFLNGDGSVSTQSVSTQPLSLSKSI